MLRRSLALALVPALLTAPLAAERLLVAGPDGFVMAADTDHGTFEYYACLCSGPIRALASDERRVYTTDDFGQLLTFRLADGLLQGFASPGLGPIDALAASGGVVFAGLESGLVARIDPFTGTVLGTRTAPAGVRALLARDGFLIAAGADGAIYRAPIAGGDFEYFTCFCFFDVQAMAMAGDAIVVADGFGTVGRIDPDTGDILAAFFVGPTNSMAVADGDLLFYYAAGNIQRFDAQTGAPLPHGYKSPILVETMLVVPDRPGTRGAAAF